MAVEVCIEAGEDAARLARSLAAARDGGADRVELCRALSVEGLTPAPDALRLAREILGLRCGLTALVRVRPGGFEHDADDAARLLDELCACLDAGADEARVGALRDGRVDVELVARAADAARAAGATLGFHRAFDVLDDPRAGLETLVGLGVARILCSGVPWDPPGSAPGTAAQGAARLADLAAAAAGRVELVLAGGISPAGAPALLSQVARPGARLALHAARGLARDGEVDAALVAQLAAVAAASRARCRDQSQPDTRS